jgi:hypothetical protein
LRESIAAFTEKVGSVNEQEALNLVLLTQYFDTIKEVGVAAGAKVIFLPHEPAGMPDIMSQIRNAIVVGNEASDGPGSKSS